jgi:hypothetical protein
MPKYPAQIDNSQTLPTAIDNLTPVQGSIFNKLRDAVLAIESELGVKPSATYTTVKARIDALEGVVGNLQIIELDKDLGGTLEEPKVIGFQGRPVSTVPPQLGDVYVWNGLAWTPGAGGGGGGGFTPPPGSFPGQTLVWTGSNYVPDFYLQDDVVPPYEMDLVGPYSFVEVNQTIVNPGAFTASYFQTPSFANFKDDVFNSPIDVTSTPTSFSSNHTFQKTVFNDNVTFTLTSTQGHVTKSDEWDIIWGQKTYYGTALAGQTGQTFIKNLPGQIITNKKFLQFIIDAAPAEKIYFACRAAYGDVVFTIHDVEGGFTKVQSNVSVTNDFGYAENYDLYESDYAGLGELLVTAGDGDDEVITGGGPVGPPGPPGVTGYSVITFRPGVATAAPVYATWAEVVAAALLVEPSSTYVTIVFDDNFANCTIPSGSWNFGKLTTFKGSPNAQDGSSGVVFVNSGATFVNSPVAYIDMVLRFSGSAPVVTSVPNSFRIDMRNAFLECTGSSSIYNVTQSFTIFLYDNSAISVNSYVPVIQTTGSLEFFMYEGSEVLDNTLDAFSSLQYRVYSSSARPSRIQTGGGTISVISGLHIGNLDPFGALSFGTTANRPILSGLPAGYRYFDTTLGKPIWWNGSAWITFGSSLRGITLPGDIDYLLSSSDDIVEWPILLTANRTATLPASPVVGQSHTIKVNFLNGFNFTINANGSLLDDPTFTIHAPGAITIYTDGMALNYVYNGTKWSLV